jgi:enterochelin esterase-like enzyme
MAVPAFGQEPRAARQWVAPEVKAPGLERIVFESAAARARVSYFIYVPEAYREDAERRFPVLYWLHGGGGSRGLAVTGGVGPIARHFDAAIRGGKIAPMLVVFPNGLDSLWLDSKDGSMPVETIVVKEVLGDVDARFRSLRTRAGRLIEGFSMGGYGAAHLGFKYPELFAAVSILSGGPLQREFASAPRVGPRGRDYTLQNVFGGDHGYFRAQSPWVLAERNAAALSSGTRIRVVIGQADEMLDNVREFAGRLKQLGIPHAYRELPGVAHQPMAVLDALGEGNWAFYRPVLGSGRPAPR